MFECNLYEKVPLFSSGCFLTDKPEQSYSEDDDECKPVQEVRGQCDQPIDVCLKC